MYIRLSEEDDDLNLIKAESGSITVQRQLIRDYIKRNREFSRCKIIERCDDGFSGTHFDTRPACTEMIEMAKRGEINCIIVKDFSRFGRNYVELGDYLEQLFPFLGVRFISINDGYDSDDLNEGETPGLSVAFQNLIYDYYSKEQSAKAKLSCRQRAEHGQYNSPAALYGYRKKPDDKRSIEIREDEAAVVREIFDMKLSGISLADIARNLNSREIPCPVLRFISGSKSDWFGMTDGFVWTASAIFHILKNEQYTGTLVALRSTTIEPGGKQRACPEDEWVKVENAHEAIITREEFAEVQNSINSHGHTKTGKKNKFRCGYCGRVLADQKKRGSMRCYRGRLSHDESCMKVSIQNEDARNAVLTALQQKVRIYLDAEERRKSAVVEASLNNTASSIENAIQAEKKAWMKMYTDYSDGRISKEDFLLFRKQYDETLEELKNRLSDIQEKEKLSVTFDQEEADAVLSATELTSDILDSFVESVDVFENNRIEIHWRFNAE